MATNDEILEAAAKNAGYIVSLERKLQEESERYVSLEHQIKRGDLREWMQEKNAHIKKLEGLLGEGTCGNDEMNEMEGLEFCDCQWCAERSELLGDPIPPVGERHG